MLRSSTDHHVEKHVLRRWAAPLPNGDNGCPKRCAAPSPNGDNGPEAVDRTVTKR
jgi:hypothetical protein